MMVGGDLGSPPFLQQTDGGSSPGLVGGVLRQLGGAVGGDWRFGSEGAGGDLGSSPSFQQLQGGCPSGLVGGSVRLQGEAADGGWRLANGGSSRRGHAEAIQLEPQEVNSAGMDCTVNLHGPVPGTMHEVAAAGVNGEVASMHMEGTCGVGGTDSPSLNGFPGTNNPNRIDLMETVGNFCPLPLDGTFRFGSSPPVVPSCGPGVRSFVSTKNAVSGSPGGPSMGATEPVGQPRSAWNKPVLVRLPGRAELGEAAVRGGRVQLDEEDVLATVKRFDMALVGRLFGRRLSFDYLNMELHHRWNGIGTFKVVSLSGDCFVCFFDSIESWDVVLMGGP